jgi:hypothetical protein
MKWKLIISNRLEEIMLQITKQPLIFIVIANIQI